MSEPGQPPAAAEKPLLTVPPPTMTARLASTVLLLEAFAVFFGTLVGSALLPGQGIGRGWVWAVGGVLTLLCVLASGSARRPGGLVLGTAVQVLLLLTGLAVPAMFAVGIGFGALWWWLVSIGRRVDADRRRWAQQAAAGQPLT